MFRTPKMINGTTHLSDRFHGASDFGADFVELAQVPPGDLDHAVVKTRLEARCRFASHGVDLKKKSNCFVIYDTVFIFRMQLE